MGISASVGLTVFLFGIGWDFMQNVAGDVTVVREDVAYIKGVISTWDAEYPNILNSLSNPNNPYP